MTDKRVLNSNDSDAIKIARVLCILCVVYMHMPPHMPLFDTGTVAYNDYLWIVREAIGRTSVPLLSVISGYFIARMLSTGSWQTMIGKKVVTLIVPLVLWNVIALTKKFVFADSDFTFSPFNLHNYLLSVTEPPAMWVLYFLRDMFVASLLAPLLIWLGQRFAWITAGILVAVAVTGIDGPLFLNSMIPLFFFAGLLIYSGKLSRSGLFQENAAYGVMAAAVVAGLAILPIILFAFDSHILTPFGNNIRILLIRIIGAAVFWIMAMSMVGTGWGKRLICLEPVIFFIFCIHPLIIDTVWRMMDRYGLDESPPAVIAYFVSGPLVVLLLAVPLVWMGTRIWPAMMRWLGGGRIPSPVQWQSLWAALLARPVPKTKLPADYVNKKM